MTGAPRMPPFDASAEGAVLSACLYRGAAAVDEVVDLLTPDRFYSETHRRIFEACVALASDSSPVDPVTVGTWLREHGRLEQVGGLAHLVKIVASAPALTEGALRAYATAVRNCATLRDVLATCQRAAAEIYEGVEETEPFVQGLEAKLHDVTMARRSVAVTPMKEVLRGSIEALRRRQQSGVVGGIPTGLVDLDFVTGGLHETDLTVVAARPGMGKTSFALQLAIEACRRGRGALFFSLEMGEEQIGNRVLCMDARVNLQGMRTGQFRPAEWGRLDQAVRQGGSLPLFVVDQGDTPLPVMRTIVRRVQSSLARENRSLGVVVVDYLQLMTGRPGKHTRDEIVSEITRGLKGLAKESKTAVIALSQLNRDVEKRSDKHPLLSDLRESGAIEQDADNVLFLYRADYYDEHATPRGVTDIDVAKQRNGPTRRVQVMFHAESTRFEDHR